MELEEEDYKTISKDIKVSNYTKKEWLHMEKLTIYKINGV